MIELHARAAILASAVILAACGSGGAPDSSSPGPSGVAPLPSDPSTLEPVGVVSPVTGVIVAIEASGLEDVTGFTSVTAYGHGANDGELSVAEQVTGRQKRAEVRLEMAVDAVDTLLAALAAAFDGTELYYFVTPVLRSGHLRRRRT